MQRVAFLLKVKRDKIDEYKQRHKAVWPEMLQALREAGWPNYSLFLHKDGLLFGYLETDDFGRALAEMAKKDVNRRWRQEMAPFFEALDGKRPGEGLVLLEEVFHLN